MVESYHLKEAYDLLQKGAYRSTERLCRDILSKDTEESTKTYTLKLALGMALVALGQLREALALCSEVLHWSRSPSARRDFPHEELAQLGISAMLESLNLAVQSPMQNRADFEAAADEAEPLVSEYGAPDAVASLLCLRAMAGNDPSRSADLIQEAAAVRGISNGLKIIIGLALSAHGGGGQAIELLSVDASAVQAPVRMGQLTALAVELAECSPPRLTAALDCARKAVREAASTDSCWMTVCAETVHVDIAMECDAWREAQQALTKIGDLLLSEADFVPDLDAIVGRLAGIAADSWRRGARGARPYSDALIGLLRQLDTPLSKNLIDWLGGLPSTAQESARLSPRGELSGFLSRAKEAVSSFLHNARRKSS